MRKYFFVSILFSKFQRNNRKSRIFLKNIFDQKHFSSKTILHRNKCNQNILFLLENNFNSDGAKRWCFLSTTHMLTPHIKRKKCKKKNSTSSRTRFTLQKKRLHNGARKKRDRREKKKEEGRISPAVSL